MKPKPSWIPNHMPALDGLRGVAIGLVFLHHCEPRMQRLGAGSVAAWGWCGVDLFFVLSGFLITGIVLDGRDRPRFFRNFYARRGLRIWPLYALVVPLNFWLCGRSNTWMQGTGEASWFASAWWLNFALFVQNLSPGLTGTLYPSWSLAIEEQFYLLWAPVARFLPIAGLYGVLGATLATSPLCRAYWRSFTAVHTLYHLDGLAAGSLAALALRTIALSRRQWRRWSVGLAATGLGITVWAAQGHGSLLDTGIAMGFTGLVLLTAGSTASMDRTGSSWAAIAEHIWQRPLRAAPMRFLGRISYGFYLTHVIVFAMLGGVDAYLDHWYAGVGADLAIVGMRFVAAAGVATLLWYGLESPLLRLKRYFVQPGPAATPATPDLAPSTAR